MSAERPVPPTSITSAPAPAVPHWAVLALALALLNAALTLGNIWPTPFVRLTGDLSAELAVALLVLVAARRWIAARRILVLRLLASAWVLLMLGRYAAITSQSLWGRDINLYWDMPHVPAVGAMLAAVATPKAILAAIGALVIVPLVLYAPLRWAFGRVFAATADARLRGVLVVLPLLTFVVGAAQRVSEEVPQSPGVATPVTFVWAQQARQFVYEWSGRGLRDLGPAPVVTSNLAGVQGADIVLLFIESYGAVSWERPSFASALTRSRTQFLDAIDDTGRDVVSAYVESPTFGGESWLAHVSMLSGTEVRDGATNARLMAQQRDTMVTPFTRHGYRTVAIMPGIKSVWPEGKFYGFDQIYGADALEYQGPTFGWWDLTDQYALAKMHAMELAATDRPPVFVVLPTISTHTPFLPVPPYQPDWSRMLSPEPYDQAVLDEAWSVLPDWLDLSPGYLATLQYAYETLGGYLRLPRERDLVLIVIGDHQPPALVSGEGAPWDVPIHVITNRHGVLERLRQRGFTSGLAPARPVRGKMHETMPVLLDAFGDGQ